MTSNRETNQRKKKRERKYLKVKKGMTSTKDTQRKIEKRKKKRKKTQRRTKEDVKQRKKREED